MCADKEVLCSELQGVLLLGAATAAVCVLVHTRTVQYSTVGWARATMTWIKVPSMRWSRNVFRASFYKVAVVLETPKQNGGIMWLPYLVPPSTPTD